MRKNIGNVIATWRNGGMLTEKTCSTDGVYLYSYRMKIARRGQYGGVTMYVILPKDASPSVTTSSHMNAVHEMLGTGVDVVAALPRTDEEACTMRDLLDDLWAAKRATGRNAANKIRAATKALKKLTDHIIAQNDAIKQKYERRCKTCGASSDGSDKFANDGHYSRCPSA